MKSLRFQRLVLISDSQRMANQFEFPKRLNIVTGKDNSIGKSTLVKSVFWALGCEPKFDQEWKSKDIKAILYFSVDDKNYIVSRHNDRVSFGNAGEELKKYSKITGQYSIDFASVVGFDLVLENRSGELECPPPAFYFLPFYIDQEKSWGEPWNAFEHLTQFSRFKATLIKYFCGYIKPEYFEIEEEIFEEKLLEKEANNKVERILSAIEVIEEIPNKNNVALSDAEIESIQAEIGEELEIFVNKQISLFDSQLQIKSEAYDLEKQLSIALSAVNELEEDYAFAVEYLVEDELECPLCGTIHNNSLVSRAGLLVEKSSLENQVDIIKESLEEKKGELLVLDKELSIVRQEVDRINKKYILLDKEDQGSFEKTWCLIAQKNVSQNIAKEKEAHGLISKQATENQKALKAMQRKLTTKKEKEELDELFIGNLTENIQTLSALGVNLVGVKSPMHYKKLLGGGAAEGTRGVLAYQLAILRQIENAGNCALPPFVIDTPNQQEQAGHRYQRVVDVIKENVPSHFQIILCGMDNEAITSLKEGAHVINLDEKRLLDKVFYKSLRSEYESIVIGD